MYKNKEWLTQEFLVKNRSAIDLAAECQVTPVTIRWWARHFGLHRRRWGSIHVNDDFFHVIDSERKAYWLGFLAADGSVQNKKAMRWLAVWLCKKDRGHLEKLKRDLSSDHKISDRLYSNHSPCVQLMIGSEKLVSDLIVHGIVPNKTLILKPPSIPKKLVRHWIRGYFDGDGSVSFVRGQVCVNLIGTKSVIKYICSCCSWLQKPYQRQNESQWFTGFAGNKKAALMYNYLYRGSTVFLERKEQIFRRSKHVILPDCRKSGFCDRLVACSI